MAEEKMMRLSQVARKLNVGTSTIADHLSAKGFSIENNPNSKVTLEQFDMLMKEFASSIMDKEEASGLTIGKKHSDVVIKSDPGTTKKEVEDEDEIFIKNVSPSVPELDETAEDNKQGKVLTEEDPIGKVKLQGIKVVGKIDLGEKKKIKPEAETEASSASPAQKASQSEEPVTAPAEVEKTEPIVSEPPIEKPAAAEEIKSTPETEPVISSAIPTDTRQSEPEILSEAKEETVNTHEEPAEARGHSEHLAEPELINAKADQLKGLTVLGKIELPSDKSKKKKPVASSDVARQQEEDKKKAKKKRKRLRIENNPVGGGQAPGQGPGQGPKPGNQFAGQGQNRPGHANFKKGGKPVGQQSVAKEEVSDKEIQDKIKATLAKLSGGGPAKKGTKRSKYRKEKRSAFAEAEEERLLQQQEDAKTLKVTEYISANDLASLLGVSVNEVISASMGLGMFVSINQRLDAEAITVITDEFGYNVDFTNIEEEEEFEQEEVDDAKDLSERAPIITIMGHVDHGKTSLLDYIRKTKVAAGEAGGITQHIGAYSVVTESGKKITFLDTPGHEAFTAMRARGAKVTDIVIIVVAADDAVMPQTKEAINHSLVAGVPIVIAINKIDKPTANPDKIKEELANENILVEDWGGKYQCEMISAKSGLNINSLLDKVLLEAELLDLKANPDRNAVGTVVEASLDKGRGYIATILVQNGTLSVGDVILSGAHYGRVKAMMDHRGNRIEKAGPSTPVLVLGLNGAPQAGDKIKVMESEREAREIASKREQVLREQSIRTKKHITLDEIGRRLAIGNFKELNVIVKGDVDGSVEALSDSLLKLSTEEIQIRILHKGVGQISESDVLLASASDAIIVGFQVRPSSGARRLAENEEIEIRLYSIIYDAIDEIKDAMEGMLAPKLEEVITGNVDVREVFKISKIGTVAGCYVTEGFIKRNSSVRLIRDGIVVHTGSIDALKRFKDDVAEVRYGYECGISIRGFNDIRVGDNIEPFETKETKRTL